MSFPVFLPSTCLEVRSSTQKSINDILIYGREIYTPTKRQITYTCEVKACLLTRKNVPMEDAISVLAKRDSLTLGRLPPGYISPPLLDSRNDMAKASQCSRTVLGLPLLPTALRPPSANTARCQQGLLTIYSSEFTGLNIKKQNNK